MNPDYEIFNRNWSLYQKIIAADYMHHRTIGTEIMRTFHELSGELAEIIDLGCGDAQEIARQARHFQIRSFTGFDLSAMALQIAKKNLDFVPKVSLLCEPMESIGLYRELTANFVFSGYALHHLDDEGKRLLVDQVHRVLKPGGHFLVADVFRKAGQSRPAYLAEYIDMIQTYWTLLTSAEMTAVIDHLEAWDFPASSDDFIEWASASGFDHMHSAGDNHQHQILHFRKNTD